MTHCVDVSTCNLGTEEPALESKRGSYFDNHAIAMALRVMNGHELNS